MCCSFILLTTTTILSVVVPSHTVISFPQFPTSELIRTYCDVTDNSDVFPLDVIPLHSSTPIDLLPNTLYCKAIPISNETRNMSSVHGATAESSLDIADGESLTLQEYLVLTVLIPVTCAVFVFSLKINSMQEERLSWREQMSNDSGSSTAMSCRKVYLDELVVSVRIYEDDVIPDVAIDMYLLKEAFKELERHPEIYEDPKLYDFATEFMLETVKRAVFMKIPTDRKVAWLKNRYIRNMLVANS